MTTERKPEVMGKKALEISQGRYLLQMGFLDDNSGFAMGWNSEMIKSLRALYKPEDYNMMVQAIEISIKHFLRELHGGVQ